MNNVNIAVIDDSGFGIGRPGLFGKEQYVEIISRIYEDFFGWNTFRIVISREKPVTSSIGNRKVYWIPYFKLKITGDYLDPFLVNVLKRFIEKHGIRIIHNNVLNPRIPLHIIKASRNNALLVTTLHSWVYVCPTAWGVKLPSLTKCNTGFQQQCIKCTYIYSKLYNLGKKGFLDVITRYFIFREVVRDSNILISPTSVLRDHIIKVYSIRNIYQIYNPLPPEILDVKPMYINDRRVLFFGRLEWEKGAHIIPYLALRNPDIEFHVLGRGRLSGYIKAYSRKIPNLKYHGYVDEEFKRKMLRSVSAVIVPSIYMETFGYTVAEAFAYGKPVIGFGIGGVGELVRKSGGGVVVEPYNVDELARILYDVVENAKILGEKGRLFVLGNLSVNNYYESLKRIYERIGVI